MGGFQACGRQRGVLPPGKWIGLALEALVPLRRTHARRSVRDRLWLTFLRHHRRPIFDHAGGCAETNRLIQQRVARFDAETADKSCRCRLLLATVRCATPSAARVRWSGRSSMASATRRGGQWRRSFLDPHRNVDAHFRLHASSTAGDSSSFRRPRTGEGRGRSSSAWTPLGKERRIRNPRDYEQ